MVAPPLHAQPEVPPSSRVAATEIDAASESRTDPLLTRRLIALELADIEVPPRPGSDEPAALFFRVLDNGPGALRVELWERGEQHGSRRVSADGSPRLVARRVAIAAAQLAGSLRRERLWLVRQAQREAAARPELEPLGDPLHARFVFFSEVRSLFLTDSSAWAVGPGLGGGLRFDEGPALDLAVGYLAGRAGELEDVGLRSLELALRVAPDAVGGALRFAPGIELALSALHFPGAGAVSGERGNRDDIVGRLALDLAGELSLGERFSLAVAPQFGFVVDRVQVEDDAGGSSRVGGPWLGLRVGLVFDPRRGRLYPSQHALDAERDPSLAARRGDGLRR